MKSRSKRLGVVFTSDEINPGSGEIIPRMSPIAQGTLGRPK